MKFLGSIPVSMGMLALMTTGYAQTPVRLWTSFFNGNFNGKDEARSVVSGADGSVLVTGTSYHFFAGGNFTTIKYDSTGNQVWADHYYSAQQGGFNGGKKLVRDGAGYFYAVGNLAMNDGDLAVIKYGPNGRLWTYNYQPYWFTTYEDYGMDIGLDGNGNFYAIAEVMSPSGNMEDLYIMKCDSAGTKLWDDNYSGGSGSDYPRALAVAASGNTYSTLSTFNAGGSGTYDLATRKYTSAGNPGWTAYYNGTGNAVDFPSAIDIDAGENTYVCGSADTGPTNDMVCYKQNAGGTRLWTVTYGGTAMENDTAVAIRKLSNNLVAVTGRSREILNGITRHALVTMLIDSGTILWTKKYFGADSLGATPTAMITDAAGNLVICGYEETPLMFRNGTIISYDMSGNLLWSDSFDSGSGLNDRFNALTSDDFGNIIVTGQSFSNGTSNSDYVTVKYGSGTPMATNEKDTARMVAWPNPVARGQNISIAAVNHGINSGLTVTATDGRQVILPVSTDDGRIQINTSALQPGMYFISSSGFTALKFIVQ